MAHDAEYSLDQPPASQADCSVELDPDLHRWFQDLARCCGGEATALVNAVLRDHVRRSAEPLERTLRRVLREELRKAG
ncbi:MAG: CopG family transcriptional regulator [Proteobacteria bacterium]|nr:CopG family transcriptional regulator [Pseudomonadota bacterium]